jgi:hypothetical protein
MESYNVWQPPAGTCIPNIYGFSFVSNFANCNCLFGGSFQSVYVQDKSVASTPGHPHLLWAGLKKHQKPALQVPLQCLFVALFIITFQILCYVFFWGGEGAWSMKEFGCWWVLTEAAVPLTSNFLEGLGFASRGIFGRFVRDSCTILECRKPTVGTANGYLRIGARYHAV